MCGDGDKVIILNWMSKKLVFHVGGDQGELVDALGRFLLAGVVEDAVVFRVYFTGYILLRQAKTPRNVAFKPFLRVFSCVGMTGFEPAASCSQSRRPTGLGYIP